MMAGDITENAKVELQNISTDPRSLRDQTSFYINTVIFDSPFEFRIYTINDILQIRVKDINETFASLKLAEMPLCKDDLGLVHYI